MCTPDALVLCTYRNYTLWSVESKYVYILEDIVVIYLKTLQREIMPFNKAHTGGLLEKEREGTEKRAERGTEMNPWV